MRVKTLRRVHHEDTEIHAVLGIHPIGGIIERARALADAFRARSLPVVIVGVATGTGVGVIARQAYELGFNVTLTVDAMTDRRP